MDIPPGFSTTATTGKVCRLKKTIYELKQSPRTWFGKFQRAMVRFGYKQGNSDHTMFVKRKGEKITVLIVYVDDIVITSNDTCEIADVKRRLASEFEMKDLGKLRYFLGIEVSRSPGGIFLSQRKYTLDLLNETDVLGCRPADSPIEANHKLYGDTGDTVDITRYQRLVGRLIYLSHTRQDIAYVVGVVSRYMHDPRQPHLDAVYMILRYLKAAPGKGVMFTNNEHLGVESYTNADWVGCLDDRRSTSGYYTFVGCNLVTWRNKKQLVVALSSAEAEYQAMARGVRELLWIRLFLTELGLTSDTPMKLHCDNKSAIAIAHDPVQHDRAKHIEIDRHFIKENINNNVISIQFVRSEDQRADVLTKGLSGKMIHPLIDKLGMSDIYAPT
ncbi:hypothetical protein AgCh_028637 [Apium graveolens]